MRDALRALSRPACIHGTEGGCDACNAWFARFVGEKHIQRSAAFEQARQESDLALAGEVQREWADHVEPNVERWEPRIPMDAPLSPSHEELAVAAIKNAMYGFAHRRANLVREAFLKAGGTEDAFHALLRKAGFLLAKNRGGDLYVVIPERVAA